jgi:hypothetical protein
LQETQLTEETRLAEERLAEQKRAEEERVRIEEERVRLEEERFAEQKRVTNLEIAATRERDKALERQGKIQSTVGGAVLGGTAGAALGGSIAAGAAGTALAGQAAALGSAAGPVGAIVGAVIGFVAGGSWICTEVNKTIELSPDTLQTLKSFKDYAKKNHRPLLKWYLSNGPEIVMNINNKEKAQFYEAINKDMIEPVCEAASNYAPSLLNELDVLILQDKVD